MKLVHIDLEQQIVFGNNQGCEWIIESPKLFAKYIQELYGQAQGKTGSFVLTEDDKQIDIEKSVEVIVNPFSANMNDKKILNKLYAELTELAYEEELYLLTQEMMSKLQDYVLRLEYLSPYVLEMDSEPDISSVLKALGVKIENYTDDYFENLNLYIKIIAELLKKKLLVLVNIGSYLEKEQIQQLIETAVHSEIKLLLIENYQRDFSGEFIRYILDKDGCEI